MAEMGFLQASSFLLSN